MEERLRKFAFLVDAGSFTKASKELHVSQPALSASIAKLERELSATLVVHGSRPLEFTDAGRLAYDTAQQLLAQTESLTQQLAVLERKQRNFSVGMIDSVASAIFSSSNAFDELDSQADVSIVVNNSRFLLDAVAKGELDLVLTVAHNRPLPDGLAAYFVANEPLVLVCNADLAEATTRAMARGRLPRFIAYDRLSTTRQLIADALRERGISPYARFSSTSPEVMLRLVQLRKGAAVLPYLLVRELITGGALALPGAAPIIIERRISSVVVRGSTQIQAAATLITAAQRALSLLDNQARAQNSGAQLRGVL